VGRGTPRMYEHEDRSTVQGQLRSPTYPAEMRRRILAAGRLTGCLSVAPDDLALLAPPRNATTAAAEDGGCADEEPEHVPAAVVVHFEDVDVGSEK
jgi:hypothetical protein